MATKFFTVAPSSSGAGIIYSERFYHYKTVQMLYVDTRPPISGIVFVINTVTPLIKYTYYFNLFKWDRSYVNKLALTSQRLCREGKKCNIQRTCTRTRKIGDGAKKNSESKR